MGSISIQEALARIAEAGDMPFRLAFVRSGGKQQGVIKTVVAYYGAPNPKRGQATEIKEGGARKQRSTHLYSGTIPLTEASTERRMLTPRISHIIAFNNQKVIH